MANYRLNSQDIYLSWGPAQARLGPGSHFKVGIHQVPPGLGKH